MAYAWLNDSLHAIKVYQYFDIISNTAKEGNLLISLTRHLKIIISILHSSRRCYKVSYTYIKPSVPVLLQEFMTFPTSSALCDWLLKVIERDFKDIPPRHRLNIENYSYMEVK